MALSCNKKTISIIKRNNYQISWWFLLSEKLKSRKKAYGNKDFCNVIMPYKETKILEFNQYQKYDKVPFIIYADLECIIEKIDGLKNIPVHSNAPCR